MRARVLVLSSSLGIAAAWAVGACATGVFDGPDASDGSVGGDGGGDRSDSGGTDAGCVTPNTTCYFDGGKVCTDTKTDPNHCGICTHSCFAPVEGCDGGVCVSACAPKTECIPDAGPIPDGGDAAVILPPYCADLLTDDSNCGQCGNSCGGTGCDAGACNCVHGTKTFAYTGALVAWVVPCGTHVTITAAGAQGANATDVSSGKHTGGLGGSATGTLAVVPGETLYVSVGGQGSASGTGGWNGGAAGGASSAGQGCMGGPAGGGGGMSDVRQGGMALGNIVIAGGGGGGSGRDYCNGTCVPCGCGGGNGGGGGATGVAGGAAYNCGFGYPGSSVNGGQGGTQASGGTSAGDGTGAAGTSGSQGTGGGGAAGAYDVAGGGGGGGYYGGGGGGSASSGSGVGGGGGGGGSSYIAGVTGGSTTSATQSGDGQITITW